jgi:hypothetical protein
MARTVSIPYIMSDYKIFLMLSTFTVHELAIHMLILLILPNAVQLRQKKAFIIVLRIKKQKC